MPTQAAVLPDYVVESEELQIVKLQLCSDTMKSSRVPGTACSPEGGEISVEEPKDT